MDNVYVHLQRYLLQIDHIVLLLELAGRQEQRFYLLTPLYTHFYFICSFCNASIFGDTNCISMLPA